MLKTILSITGRPGLFKIVTNGKNMLLVEDLKTKKRMPAYARDRIVSLGDISIYTDAEEVPLADVFQKAYELYENKTVDVKEMVKGGTLRAEFAKVLPEFDRERVYDNDIRKFYMWYNLLLETGHTDFKEEEAVSDKGEAQEA